MPYATVASKCHWFFCSDVRKEFQMDMHGKVLNVITKFYCELRRIDTPGFTGWADTPDNPSHVFLVQVKDTEPNYSAQISNFSRAWIGPSSQKGFMTSIQSYYLSNCSHFSPYLSASSPWLLLRMSKSFIISSSSHCAQQRNSPCRFSVQFPALWFLGGSFLGCVS